MAEAAYQCGKCGSTLAYEGGLLVEQRQACATEGCFGADNVPIEPEPEPDNNWKDSNPKDATQAVEGRVPLGMFPDTALIAGAMAFHEGAEKYGRYNYRVIGVRASVYHDALMRHLCAWWAGEDIDQASGLPHLWKALACIAILIDSKACEKLTDDRPPKAPVARMLEDLKPVVRMIQDNLKDYTPQQYTIEDSVS